jgi:hypothetical protein
MLKNQPRGTHMQRLIALFVARLAVPDGATLAGTMELVKDSAKMREIVSQSAVLADHVIAALRAAPDNGQGFDHDDVEALAGLVIAHVEKRLEANKEQKAHGKQG